MGFIPTSATKGLCGSGLHVLLLLMYIVALVADDSPCRDMIVMSQAHTIQSQVYTACGHPVEEQVAAIIMPGHSRGLPCTASFRYCCIISCSMH